MFAENYDFETGESVYESARPFLYGDAYVDALDLDAFWRWVLYQHKIANLNSSGPKYSDNDHAELMKEAMNVSISAKEIWMRDDCNLASILR